MKFLKQIIIETIVSLNETELAADILKAAHKNVLKLTGSHYDVPKYDLESSVRSSPVYQKLPTDERLDLDDIISGLPDSVSVQDIVKAANNLRGLSVPEKQAPVDFTKTPMPNQVNVPKIIDSLAERLPNVFGQRSESSPDVQLLSKSVSEGDKKFFTHGMEVNSNNLYGDTKKIFPKDASGQPLRRPDGSIIFFKIIERLRISAMYDVYTGTFVSIPVFDNRNQVYTELMRKGLLPSPINMARSKVVRSDKI